MNRSIKYLFITLLCCITQVIDGSLAQQSRTIAAGQGARSGLNIASTIAVNDDDDTQDTFNLESLFGAPAAISRRTTTNNDDDADTTSQTATIAPDNTITFREIALRIAANSRWPALFEPFTAPSASIDVRDSCGRTLLMHAAFSGDTISVIQLLKLHADIEAKDCSNHTALIHALLGKNCVSTIQALLDARANVHAKDFYGYTPLTIAYELENNEILNLVALRDSNVLLRKPYVALVRILPGVNKSDAHGNSPLHHAVNPPPDPKSGQAVAPNPDNVVLLLCHGAYINGRNGNRETAVLLAVKNRHVDITQILVDAKANLDLTDNHGNSPLSQAVSAHDPDSLTIINMLVNAGANAHAIDVFDYTPFLCAALNPNNKALRALLQAGVDPIAQNQSTQNPLSHAFRKGCTDIIEILIKAGFNINSRNSLGNTALHLAVYNWNLMLVKKLIYLGADTSIENADRQTALDIARKMGNPEIIALLSNNDANAAGSGAVAA